MMPDKDRYAAIQAFLNSDLAKKGPVVRLTVSLDHEALEGLVKKAADKHAAELARLTELWMDAVCQGTRQEKVGDEYRHFDGAISTWEEAFYELEQRGLAEGNERDGWVLRWPENKENE